MTEYLFPALFALVVWWSSTGLILHLDGLPRRTFAVTLSAASVLLVASMWGVHASAGAASVFGAYLAFGCGLAVWGWQQLAFYTGYLAGPRRRACAEGCRGWPHFLHALEATLYHELAVIVSAISIWLLTADQPNQIALWTFLLLWGMHLSAQLNLFLGVRNLNEEFFPEHLRYLGSFLRVRPMNVFFPFSVVGSSLLSWLLVRNAIAVEATPFEAVGATLLATLAILAVIEHLFLVLPLPAARLWSWGLRSREATESADIELRTSDPVDAPASTKLGSPRAKHCAAPESPLPASGNPLRTVSS